MPKYDVKSPVKVKSEIHKPGGDPLELDAKTAAPLLASGALAEAGETRAPARSEAKADTKAPAKK